MPEADRHAAAAPDVLFDPPHAREHALEVQVPFLQAALGDFRLIRASRFETIEIKWAPPGDAAAPDVLQRVIGLAARYTAAVAGTA